VATTPHSRIIRMLAIATAAAGIAAATPAAAAGAAPCAERLIEDWSDGRIDGTYDPACYRDALAALPEDVRTYSTAQDDITAALYQRVKSLADRPPRRAVQSAKPAKPARSAPAAVKARAPRPTPERAALGSESQVVAAEPRRLQAVAGALALLLAIAVPLLVTARGRWRAGRLRSSARPAR